MKTSGNVSELSNLLLQVCLTSNFEVLNAIFLASTEPEWIEYIQELLIDAIWLLDLEFCDEVAGSNYSLNASSESVKSENDSSLSTERDNLISFVSLIIHQSNHLPFALLLERLEPDFLQAINVVASADLFNKKVIKINTAMFYRQQKFNLLREESEGFSRLIILIASSVNFSKSPVDVYLLYDRVLEMIGFFDLDPLKVLDILLESFVFGLSAWRDFLNLLKKFSFPSASIVGILGFKLAYIHEDQKFSSEYLEQIFTVIGLLLSEGLFELKAIWPHLLPSDEGCLEQFHELKQKIIESGAKIGVVNLSTNNSSSTFNNTNLLAPESLTEHFAQDNLNTKLIPSLCFDRNLKSHLLLALLSIGSADLALQILSKYPHLALLNHKISKQICAVIEGLLDGSNFEQFLFGQLKASEESKNVKDWLNLLPSGGLFHCPRLFSKICRNLSQFPDHLIHSHLLPALSCSSHDGLILSQELWENVIGKFPYAQRYSIYGGWLDNFYEANSAVESTMIWGPLIRANSIGEARKVMRRLAKENVRQYGRLVAKVTHSNPVIVLPLILDQLQAYDNIIPAVVDAFRYLTPLSFDVLVFCLLRALSSPERDRLKEDGTNIAAWLQNLAQFSASIFRKYAQTLDPAPLLRYIFTQLLDDNCLDVVILQALLSHMAAIERPENVSEVLNEVVASAGPVLIEQVRGQQVITGGLTPSRRAMACLKSALESEKLSIAFLIALAQASDAVIYRMDYSHLKLISTLTDTCHSALLQYLEYLKGSLKDGDFCVSLEELVKVKKLELPVALLIARTFNLDFSSGSSGLADLFKFYHKSPSHEDFFVPEAFLRTFWSLNLQDISVPLSRYQAEIARLTTLGNPEVVLQLQQEMKEQVGKCGKMRESLIKEKDSWFVGCKERGSIVKSVIKMALLPRLLLGPMEAQFTAKFLFLLHSLGPRHFSTLSLLDLIFDGLCGNGQMISSLTEGEAHCFGRFVHECLLVLQSWQLAQEKYEREAVAPHLPGFMKRWSFFIDEPSEPESNDSDLPSIIIDNCEEEGELIENSENVRSSVDIEDHLKDNSSTRLTITEITTTAASTTTNPHSLNWEDFRHVLYKWHDTLFSSVLGLLKSDDYASIRNCVIFLSHLSGGTFPRVDKQSEELEAVILSIKGKEQREDLKVLATRYSAMLAQNKPKLVKENEFHFCASDDLNISNLKVTSATSPGSSSKTSNGTPDRKRSATPTTTSEKSPEKKAKVEHRSSERSDRDRRSREYTERPSRDSRDSRDTRDTRDTRDRDYYRSSNSNSNSNSSNSTSNTNNNSSNTNDHYRRERDSQSTEQSSARESYRTSRDTRRYEDSSRSRRN